MARELFIVARDRPDLYRYLSQTFADAENVQVVWDRRRAERRCLERHAGSHGGQGRERRHAERRLRDVDTELRTAGYAFLSLNP